MTFHENLQRRERLKTSSDRSFGLTLAIFCAFVGAFRTWSHGDVSYSWFAAALVFGVPALVCPGVLAPFNRAWTRLGLLLFKVVNPVVLAVLYYGCFMPMGLLMRAAGKDPLSRKRKSGEASYWIERVDSDRVVRMKYPF